MGGACRGRRRIHNCGDECTSGDARPRSTALLGALLYGAQFLVTGLQLLPARCRPDKLPGSCPSSPSAVGCPRDVVRGRFEIVGARGARGEMRRTCRARYLHAAATWADSRAQGASLHARQVGFAVGLSGQGLRNVKTRQALGSSVEVQIQDLAQCHGVARHVRHTDQQGPNHPAQGDSRPFESGCRSDPR